MSGAPNPNSPLDSAPNPNPNSKPDAGRFNSWRVAVRIARRDAWRSKGRSAMVLAMIALPIVGVSAADITIRSSQLTPEQQITRDMGAADVRLSDGSSGGRPIYQHPTDSSSITVEEADKAESDDNAGYQEQPPIDVRTALPAGSHWITEDSTYAGFKTKYGLLDAPVRELKADDPIAKGITHLNHGRYPAAPDEVMATAKFLKSTGLHVGSTIRARDLDRVYRIVGAYELPSNLGNEELIALPGAFINPYAVAVKAATGRAMDPSSPSYLVTTPGGWSWAQVQQRANTKGVTGLSRKVLLHRPPAADVPYFNIRNTSLGPGGYGGGPDGDRTAAVATATTIVSLSMLEICLLAGPAFAVGARRSRRQLGLVGANGGDRRHIRAIVLSGGLVIGAVAAVIGTVLGLLFTVVLRGTLETYVGKRFGGLELRPAELLGIAALAVLTGLLAAIVPAFTASRQSVLASLTGRRGVRHANRALPVVGLGAVCLGAGIAIVGAMHSDNSFPIGVGSGIAELGVVALTPTLVGLFGRAGKWLPLAPRLALRDAVRNRGRTAPAVAAVLAAVAGTVAVATYAASADRQDQQTYQARMPHGVVSVAAYAEDGRDLGAIRAAVEKRYPVSGRADVGGIVYGGKGCATFYSAGDHCGDVQPQLPKANICPATEELDLSLAQRRALATDPRCQRSENGSWAMQTGNNILVGGPAILHALGIRDGAAEQALARGETVLFDKLYADHGSLKLKITLDPEAPVPDGQDPVGPVRTVPVHVASDSRVYGIVAVMPQKAVQAAGVKSVPLGSFFTNRRMPNSQERQALDADIAKIGTNAEIYLERGYTSENNLVLLALTIFAGLVTVGAAGIATGLAQADAEPDLKTLAAIGAAPRVRRMLSGFQCGVIAFMGVVLGSAAGILPAVGLRRATARSEWNAYHASFDDGFGGISNIPHVPVVIPWATLGMLLIAVPLGATLLAALVTRSRSGLARRAEP